VNFHVGWVESSVAEICPDSYRVGMNFCTDAAHRALRLLLADDHEMVRLALRQALSPLAPSIDWREASDAASVEAELDRCDEVDLALVDLHMPGTGMLGWIPRLRALHPSVPLVVLSADEDPSLVRTLIGQGVSGFIPKSDRPAVILQAVRLVLSGGTYAPLRLMSGAAHERGSALHTESPSSAGPMGLTARQSEVLRLLARGLPNKLIARELQLSEGTIKVHLLAIYRVLGVCNRTQAVMAAQKKLRADGREAEAPGVPGS